MENFESPAGNSVPQIIANNLRIEAVLGRGGMGTVYRATHLTLDRTVAVKVINPEVAMNEDVMQRFAREARLMARLRHPRAAMIYDSGTLPDGRLYIVMEYVEGTTLADILKRDGKLPYKKAVDIAVSVCDVLGEAHSLGIIHRDLKPANVMLNNRGVFVLDFGIAKMLNMDNAESMRLSMTGKGLLVGTPFYMSPEQCLGEQVTERSDLYSLGAMLFETITGRPPFDDEVLSAVIIKHATVEAPRIEQIAPEIPPALASVVNLLLSKKPGDRPQTAAAAKAMLETSVAGATSPALNLKTQTTTADKIYPSTQQLNAVTSSQTAKPLATVPNETARENKGGTSGLKIAAASASAVILIGALAIGAFFYLRSSANPVAANTNTKQMPEMDHSKHNMDEDYVKTTPPNDDKTVTSTQILSTEEADKIITEITRTTEHHADGMQIVKTPKDSALVCLHNKIAEGKTHMFAVERANLNSAWEITARTSLDTPEFKGASWIFEPQDVDGDGFEEVIYKGATADNMTHRILIYVPRTRQSYTILSATDAGGQKKNTLSPNALVASGTAFRKALEQMVRAN